MTHNYMTEEEIVLETIKYYRTHPRSLSESTAGGCRYIGPNGERCAFSRCCTAKSQFVEGDACDRQPEARLQRKYKGHPIDFWLDLQSLHDDALNWHPNPHGGSDLSEFGKGEVFYHFRIKIP